MSRLIIGSAQKLSPQANFLSAEKTGQFNSMNCYIDVEKTTHSIRLCATFHLAVYVFYRAGDKYAQYYALYRYTIFHVNVGCKSPGKLDLST